MVLVALDEGEEDTEVSKDISRQYAREKQLDLIELSLDDQEQVDRVFDTIVHKILDTWQGHSEGTRSHGEVGRGKRKKGRD